MKEIRKVSRFRRFIHGAASGYAVLVATSLYALTSYPLALHYLPKKRFALWVLMGNIGGYLNLVDLGMSGSVSRLLIDHKDDEGSGLYGGLIKTGWLVLAAQASLLFLVGLALAPLLGGLLDIPPEFQEEFVQLMRWQSATLALSLGLRLPSHLLYAHQRQDLIGYIQMGTLILNFTLLWFFFHIGQGVFSLAWSGLLATLSAGLFSLALCRGLGFFPRAGAWGRASWQQFRELFGYGKDLFLVAVGSQMILASQTLIITRRLGLEAAAAWAVGTRAFGLLSQMVCRIADVSAPALSEMMVRQEHTLLRQRYQALVMLTGSFSAFVMVGYALCNGAFVGVWMQGQFSWPPGNDLLLGAWLLVLALGHCHVSFVVQTKQIGFLRYVFFAEGVVFLSAALLVARQGGLPAVIACSVVCSTLFSGAYSLWRASRYFQCSVYEIGFGWLAPMGRLLALLAPMALLGWWGLGSLAEALARVALATGCLPSLVTAHPGMAANLARLTLNALLSGTVGFYLFLRYGLSASIQRELFQRAPTGLQPLLQRVFLSPTGSQQPQDKIGRAFSPR